MRTILIQLLIVCLTILGGILFYYSDYWALLTDSQFTKVQTAEEKTWPVLAAPLSKSNHQIIHPLFGHLVATNKPKLSFPIAGCVKAMASSLLPGTVVNKGDVLVELDIAALQIDLREAESRILELKSLWVETEVALHGYKAIAGIAQKTVNLSSKSVARQRKLTKLGSTTYASLELALKEFNNSVIALKRVQHDMKVSQAKLETITTQIAIAGSKRDRINLKITQSKLIAPVDGVIETYTASIANCISANEVMVTMIDRHSIIAEIKWPIFLLQSTNNITNLLGRTLAGSYTIGNTKTPFSVKITNVGPTVEKQQGIVIIRGKIVDKNNHWNKITGRKIQISYPLQSLSGLYRLPQNLVFEAKRIYAIKDERLLEIAVELVASHDQYSYFRANLSDDLPILMTPLRMAMPGLKVRIVKQGASVQ